MSMWKRRSSDEEITPRPAAAPAPSVEPTLSAPPIRSYEPEMPRGVATIGKGVSITGQITSREDLIVDGNIEGTVEVHEHRVTIGPNGRVNATIKARHIVIQGQVNGDLQATEKLEIRKGAYLIGDVTTGSIVIEDGGLIKGSIDIVRQEPKAAPAAATASPVSQSAAAPVQQSLAAAAGAGSSAEKGR